MVEDSDANNVNAAESTVMHGKNVGDIPTSGTNEKNGIVRMALFGQSHRCAARAINVGDTRNTRRTIPDRDVQNCVMDREKACSEVARWKKWRYNIKNKKNRESRVYRDMVIGVIRCYCKNLSEEKEI